MDLLRTPGGSNSTNSNSGSSGNISGGASAPTRNFNQNNKIQGFPIITGSPDAEAGIGGTRILTGLEEEGGDDEGSRSSNSSSSDGGAYNRRVLVPADEDHDGNGENADGGNIRSNNNNNNNTNTSNNAPGTGGKDSRTKQRYNNNY